MPDWNDVLDTLAVHRGYCGVFDWPAEKALLGGLATLFSSVGEAVEYLENQCVRFEHAHPYLTFPWRPDRVH